MQEHHVAASQENLSVFFIACQSKPESAHFETKRVVSAVLENTSDYVAFPPEDPTAVPLIVL